MQQSSDKPSAMSGHYNEGSAGGGFGERLRDVAALNDNASDLGIDQSAYCASDGLHILLLLAPESVDQAIAVVLLPKTDGIQQRMHVNQTDACA
jgi:hypothetical protein